MKFNFKFYALMAALSVLTLFSCNDDEDNAPALVGTWKINSITDENCPDPSEDEIMTANADGQFCESTPDETYCNLISYSFTKTSYALVTIDAATETITETLTGIYTTEGDQLSICEDDGSFCVTVTFTISENTLTIRNTILGDCDFVAVGTK